MSRLIDVDALFKELNDNNIPWNRQINDIIMSQPTAYDVEKVVAEFEEFAKLAEDRWVNGTSTHAYQEHKCWVKASDIVRKGGVG